MRIKFLIVLSDRHNRQRLGALFAFALALIITFKHELQMQCPHGNIAVLEGSTKHTGQSCDGVRVLKGFSIGGRAARLVVDVVGY